MRAYLVNGAMRRLSTVFSEAFSGEEHSFYAIQRFPFKTFVSNSICIYK